MGAGGRPARDHDRWLGRLQETLGLEHVVLQDELVGVLPVVRDVGGDVVPHDSEVAEL